MSSVASRRSRRRGRASPPTEAPIRHDRRAGLGTLRRRRRADARRARPRARGHRGDDHLRRSHLARGSPRAPPSRSRSRLALCDAARLLVAHARARAGVPGSGDRRHGRAVRDHGPARVARRQARPRDADRLPQLRGRADPAAAGLAVLVIALGHLAPARRQCVRRAAARRARRTRPGWVAALRDATPEQVADEPRAPPRRLRERTGARGRRGARLGRPRRARADSSRRASEPARRLRGVDTRSSTYWSRSSPRPVRLARG